MAVIASAPGKLVVFGEYAVLAGAPALVAAVDRRCRAAIEPSGDGFCHAEIVTASRRTLRFRPGRPGGASLLDLVVAHWPSPGALPPWRATLDSSRCHAGDTKLGVGSSAAMLVAWAGAWRCHVLGAGHCSPGELTVGELVALHRELQHGGSGLDVAASFSGGAIVYRLAPDGGPVVSSVRLPNGVACAGVFAGNSASTRDFLASFDGWRAARPKQAAARLRAMAAVAEAGCNAIAAGDGGSLLEAVAAYGEQLEALGTEIGAGIVTRQHREIGTEAERCGVVYKVSGAGGGDLGLALATEPGALEAFARAVRARGYEPIDLHIEPLGLAVEEQAE